MQTKRTPAETDIEQKNRDLAVAAAIALHEQRADDIVVLDVRALADYADYFVIASAASSTRMRGAARHVERTLAKRGGKRLNQPDRDAGWILIDFGDILVHIFDTQARDFYRLDELWGDAPEVDWRFGQRDDTP
ncbi:MAG: ribosome silencing factor [Planctomycetes bacterium]|nr:ribosome silencing factor [Planctomycetota bacterium]